MLSTFLPEASTNSLVTKPMAFIPLRGNSTSTARVKPLLPAEVMLSATCFMVLYIERTMGTRLSRDWP